jgi:hypothetical protein
MVHRRDVVHDVAHIPVTPLGAREAGCIYEKAVGQRPDRCRGVLVRAKRPDLLRLRAREHHLGLPRRQADSCPYRGHETTDRLSECRRRLQPPDPSRLPQRPDRRVLRPGQRCLLSPDRRRRQLVHGGQPSSGSTAGGSSVATHQALSRNSVARGAGDRGGPHSHGSDNMRWRIAFSRRTAGHSTGLPPPVTQRSSQRPGCQTHGSSATTTSVSLG